jgi:hypothetical protein
MEVVWVHNSDVLSSGLEVLMQKPSLKEQAMQRQKHMQRVSDISDYISDKN